MRQVAERGTGFAVVGVLMALIGGAIFGFADGLAAVVGAALAGFGHIVLTAGLVGIVVGPAFAELDARTRETV